MSALLGYYQHRPETIHAVKHEGVHRETAARLRQLDADFELLPHASGVLEVVDRGLVLKPGGGSSGAGSTAWRASSLPRTSTATTFPPDGV